MEIGNIGKGGGNQTVKQANLGNILKVSSETTQPVDESEVFNNLYTKYGANIERCHICWAVKIYNHLATLAQVNDQHL